MGTTVPFILTLVTLLYLPSVETQTSAEAKALRTKIFVTDGYDKKVRPALDQSLPTDVYVSFYLLAINELNEVSETLKTTGYLVIEWTDQHLTWNSSDYGGIILSHWPQDDVWKPDVALKNSIKDYKELGTSTLNVNVLFSGVVSWYPLQVFQSTCSIDVAYFPFDHQTCQLSFVAWSYTNQEVSMQGGSKGIELESYQPNSAWDVTDTSWSAEIDNGEASIVFTLELRRKPMFFLLNTVLPVIMLSLLNILVFALPCESGEKASYAVTVFLAFAVFMTVISSTLPENSDSTSMFSVYIVLLTVQSTIITSISLIMVRMSNFDEHTKLPNILIYIVKISKCAFCKRNQKVEVEENKTKKSAAKIMELQDIDASSSTDAMIERAITWKEAMNALDIFLFVVFTFTILISTIVCLSIAKLGGG